MRRFMKRAKKVAKSYKRYKNKSNNKVRKYRPYPKVQMPANILRYMSSGKYGQEVKTIDNIFATKGGAYYIYIDSLTYPYAVLPLTSGTSIGCIQVLNAITQGTGIPNRIGNKVSLKSLRLRLSLVVQDNNIFDVDSRVLVVYDRQTSAATSYPLLTDMFAYIATVDNTIKAGDVYASINPNNLERYTVLMDKRILTPATNDSSNVTETSAVFSNGITTKDNWMIDEFILLKDLESVYNTTGTAVATITTGALFLVVLSNGQVDTTAHHFNGSYRLRFHDN